MKTFGLAPSNSWFPFYIFIFGAALQLLFLEQTKSINLHLMSLDNILNKPNRQDSEFCRMLSQLLLGKSWNMGHLKSKAYVVGIFAG